MERRIQNVMEDFVYDMLDPVLKTKPNVCTCAKCKDDIAALALNQLQPRYVSSEKGGLFTRAEILNSKLRTSIVVCLAEAAEIITANPRHDRE